MKLLKYSVVIGIMMLVALTISVSAGTQLPATKTTPGFDIIITLAAIGIAVLALILYKLYKRRKKAIGHEYPAHEKGKLK